MFEVRDNPSTPAGDTLDKVNVEPMAEGAAEGGQNEMVQQRHATLMELLQYEHERQGEERQQMQIDEDYQDHLQWRPEDARELMDRGQAPVVFNEGRQTIEWICGTEKRLRKDYKVLPRERDDEAMAEVKTKLIKYTDDVNMTQWHRSRAFRQSVTAGLSWLEEGVNRDPERELIYSGWEDWRNVYRDSHSRNLDYNVDARYLFRRRVVDLDYAVALLPQSRVHLLTMAGRHDDLDPEGIWYLGERLTGASETEWGTAAHIFGARAANIARSGYYDNSRRRSVELLECWYRVPERVSVFADGQLAGKIFNSADPLHAFEREAKSARLYDTVKFRMRVQICTREAPCLDMPSPFRHNRFLMVPIWGYRRARDGLAYGAWRGMRDIQDDLNKRRSKALFALSVNRIIMEKGAVDDIDDLREEAARPDGIIVKNQQRELKFDTNMGDFQANVELAAQDAQLIRNAGGVTEENLGRNTNASSGVAIHAKQDQGSLTTSEFFDNLLLAIRQAGQLRLSHIEQFYTEEKVVRIVGEGQRPIEWLTINQQDPATGEILNDITAREADFIVDAQDYRSSMAQAALEQMFGLLGQIATYAPQVVLSVLDLVVESADIQGKEEWVARIRKINGQRDPSKPPTPEEVQQEQAAAAKQAESEQLAADTARAQLGKIQAELNLVQAQIKKLGVDDVLKKVQSMLAALQAGQIVTAQPNVAPAADEITAAAGLDDALPAAEVTAPAPTQGEAAAPPQSEFQPAPTEQPQ
ncbi:portal protein [Pantoea sp. 18069]|uniref:portal protein n=1 Tax=Pantoea sp. 18069 TaxID=2681415 RepID=UPI00190F4452|nr:portal protein [Pantoea sp. 18069]